jgi:hypothetical protein
MSRNYRFDERSKEEFQRDIKAHTMTERALFLLWLDLIEKETGKRPSFKDTGCGQSGDFLEDKEVSTDPDFEVEGYGEIEVKFAKPMLTKTFHLKVNQIKSYIKREATILMVNGADEDVPEFTLLKPNTLKKIRDNCKVVNWIGFGWKPAYRIPVKDYIWRPLKQQNS